jgi:hypothetical protein
MTTTVSQVRHYSAADTAEEALLRKWCDHAASNGGSFSIEHPDARGVDGYYYAVYTINWPDEKDSQ